MARARDSQPAKSRKPLLYIAIILLIFIGAILYIKKPVNKAYYVCKYQDSMPYARCHNVNDTAYCWSYINLRSKHIEDGIIPQGDIGGTCEAVVEGREVYFTKNGDYWQ